MSIDQVADVCPPADTLADFSFGRLPPADLATISAHLLRCETCLAAMGSIDAGRDEVAAAVRQIGSLETAPPASGTALVDRVAAIATHSLPPDRVGAYEIFEEIGRGGMGAVYRARHRQLNRIVALKILRIQSHVSPEVRSRFEREMMVLGQLDHPNIVRAFDGGTVDGVSFIAMEYLIGFNLATVLRRLGALSAPDACEIVRQAAIALDYAHNQNFVHRDVKPSNLFLTQDGRIVLLDLGLARWDLPQETDPELTESGQVMGTCDYISPEQAKDSRAVDLRSDIYSLGCTLYALLTGAPPYRAPRYATNVQKILAHASEPFPELAVATKSASVELMSLVRRMADKVPARRFESAAAVANAAAPLARGSDLTAVFRRASTQMSLAHDEQVDNSRSASAPLQATEVLPKPNDGSHNRRRLLLGTAASFAAIGSIAAAVIVLKDQKGNTVGRIELADGLVTTVEPGVATITEPDRTIAKRVLRHGGRVTIVIQPAKAQVIERVEDLPEARFLLQAIDARSQPSITDADLNHLDQVAALERLNLAQTKVTDATAVRIGRLPHLHDLTLYGTPITDAGLKDVVGAPDLLVLVIGHTKVTAAGLKHLRTASKLIRLDLGDIRLADHGLQEILALRKLTHLGLQYTGLTDVRDVAQLPSLQFLDLSGLTLAEADCRALASMTKLKTLVLNGARIDAQCLATLRSALPDCSIQNSPPRQP